MRRCAEYAGGGTELGDLPRVHDHQPVREVPDQRHVVGHEDDAEAEFGLQFLDLDHERALSDDVERRGRLVHDHQVRGEEQGHGDHGPLAHAAGELVRVAAQVLGIDSDHAEYVR